MSCTTPSVIRIAPATRSGGTSDSAEAERAEQLRAVGLAVGLSGLDDAHLESLDLLQAVDQRLLRLRGLLVALAEILARALVDHDGDDRCQRVAVLAREGGTGERQQEQRKRRNAHAPHRAPAPGSSTRAITTIAASAIHRTIAGTSGVKAMRSSWTTLRHSGERSDEVNPVRNAHAPGASPPAMTGGASSSLSHPAPAVRAAPARGPGRPCSCRSACTSRC